MTHLGQSKGHTVDKGDTNRRSMFQTGLQRIFFCIIDLFPPFSQNNSMVVIATQGRKIGAIVTIGTEKRQVANP